MNLGGKQKDLLIPTELGINIIKYIFETMPYLCDLKFTSKMENDLDDIINSKNNKKEILDNIYSKITTSLNEINPTDDNTRKEKENNTGFINTRYGQCYYNKEKNTYTNIEPYLKWKKIKFEDLKDDEIRFLSSLPKKISYLNKPFNLHIGKFGLYLKDNKNNNHKLDKNLWNTYIS
jgi:hypothetical protein